MKDKFMKEKFYYSDGSVLNYYDKTKTLHREGAPAIEHHNGTKYWYFNDKFYREDGPAVEYANGAKVWYLNGEVHREGGPAVEHPNGYKEWFLNGVRYSEEEYNKLVPQKALDLDFDL